ncbi:transcriptional regulator, TetR family [Nocardia amikacinitolerans]|uniref:TetR/AcrR family transcriptional regulator n=1 Tax=Nocardia amikacinitolerans TaxID=756689 RepID=UPI00082B3BF6|nr:TetR family transcriptional regulator [Nocardia amikacinitolerans]MCP2320332.1 transcriptional regulator, TetR family [Nocardia amikacinitolerans]
MSTTDRRTLIVDAAIELIARRGLRALTHRALDTELALPPGSSSYYFRTKRALIEAIADRISARSRSDFVAAKFDAPETTELPSIAHGIAVWLDRLLLERRDHLIARHALIVDPELHARLANSLFSVARARELFRATGFPDPDTAAADFVAILEGAVFDRFAGNRSALPAGTPASITQLTTLLSAYLRR